MSLSCRLAKEIPLPESTLTGRSFLIVDDDADARQILRLTLEGRGAQVVDADSVHAAREWLHTSCPDAVLTDVAMPGEDGLTLIDWLRAQSRPELTRLPVIAVTAHASLDVRRWAEASGVAAYLVKPVHPSTLIATLRDVLRARSAS